MEMRRFRRRAAGTLAAVIATAGIGIAIAQDTLGMSSIPTKPTNEEVAGCTLYQGSWTEKGNDNGTPITLNSHGDYYDCSAVGKPSQLVMQAMRTDDNTLYKIWLTDDGSGILGDSSKDRMISYDGKTGNTIIATTRGYAVGRDSHYNVDSTAKGVLESLNALMGEQPTWDNITKYLMQGKGTLIGKS